MEKLDEYNDFIVRNSKELKLDPVIFLLLFLLKKEVLALISDENNSNLKSKNSNNNDVLRFINETNLSVLLTIWWTLVSKWKLSWFFQQYWGLKSISDTKIFELWEYYYNTGQNEFCNGTNAFYGSVDV